MTVSLSGFMGCGKSTIGRALAKALSAEGEEWLFIDLDEAVSKREGMSIPEIFREYGESRFREAECSCLQEKIGRASCRERV